MRDKQDYTMIDCWFCILIAPEYSDHVSCVLLLILVFQKIEGTRDIHVEPRDSLSDSSNDNIVANILCISKFSSNDKENVPSLCFIPNSSFHC